MIELKRYSPPEWMLKLEQRIEAKAKKEKVERPGMRWRCRSCGTYSNADRFVCVDCKADHTVVEMKDFK